MQAFALREYRLLSVNYALLPKLTPAQLAAVAARLESKGYSVDQGSLLVAAGKDVILHVDPKGLCWSRADMADALFPAIPTILGMPKRTASLRWLSGLYFRVEGRGPRCLLKFSPRLESSATWRALRSAGECALSPDERAVAAAILSACSGKAPVLTDFPSEGCRVRIYGGRQYYESKLEPAEAAATLRVAGEKGPRTTYLPADGMFLVDSGRLPRGPETRALFDALGEWCFMKAK
jgi:hypothetical protein